MKIQSYLNSPSTRLGLTIGVIMYLSYATAHHGFLNPTLACLSIFIGIFIPFYSRMSNKIEEKVNQATAMVSLGRIARFVPQLIFNLVVFLLFVWGNVFPTHMLDGLGGVIGVTLLTTCASQGMQYVALAMANREWGERNRNVIIALSANIVVTSLATIGWPLAKTIFVALGIIFGLLFFMVGILSDLRAKFYPKGGVGVFFGTFNPIHSTHLELMRKVIEQRSLRKVYIHSTIIPKLHRDALNNREIKIKTREGGMRVYAKDERADVHLNYFPTGNMFYEYETRLHLMRLAIHEAGLGDKVEVLSEPEAYSSGGFYAVLAIVKRLAGGEAIHGIHGSDLGGMWVRSIYDETGWIYPFAVVRRDRISATAIRKGAIGMTTPLVETIIENLRKDVAQFSCGGQKYHVVEGVLHPD